jgi:hypothetical protein
MTPQEIEAWHKDIEKRRAKLDVAEYYVRLMDKALDMEQVHRVAKETCKAYQRNFNNRYEQFKALIQYENGISQEIFVKDR